MPINWSAATSLDRGPSALGAMTEIEARDAASALSELAAYARLPDPMPAPGSGWKAFAGALRIEHGEAAQVIEKVIAAVPEAAEVGAADVDGVIDAVGVSARAMVEELAAAPVLELFTGAAALQAGKLAICKALVALWISVEKGMPIYRADEASATTVLGALSQEDRIADYQIRLGTAQAIRRFDRSGALDRVLGATATEGRRTAGWPIVIVFVVLAVVALVWALVEHDRLVKIDAQIAAMCLKPGADRILCRKLADAMRGPHVFPDEWSGYAIPALGAAALLAVLMLARK